MTWFEDLTTYSFLRSGVSRGGPPTLNVGWLERGRSFPIGRPAAAFVERLYELVEHAPVNLTRGMHRCDLCLDDLGEAHPWGHAEIRVTASDGIRFAAPTLIHHYVSAHAYEPPQAFVEAVLRVRVSPAQAVATDRCLGCGGTLRRVRSYDAEAIDGMGRRAVRVVTLDCDACGVSHSRRSPA